MRGGLRGIKDRFKRVTGREWRPKPTPLLRSLGDRHIILDKVGKPSAQDVPDADIIVASWWETAEWVAELPDSKGRKYYLLQDVETFGNQPTDRVIATYKLPFKRLAVSNYIASTISETYGAGHTSVVLNAIDPAQFDAPPRDRGDPFTVGFMYGGAARKNIGLTIECLGKLRNSNPEINLIGFGGPDPKQHQPLPDGVTYYQAPQQDQIPMIYASCDAWLFTSEKEGFGLPILEAMACRTPVLATHAGAAPDLIDGKNGRLLASNADVFVDAIQEMTKLANDEWRAISEAAYATAQTRTYTQATQELLQAFTEA